MAATLTAQDLRTRGEVDEEIGWRDRKWLLVAVAAAAVYPFFDSALGINRLGSWLAIFVFVILALGLNIVVGYAGLLDLGYVAFFIIGAYAAAFISSPNSILVRNDLVPGFLQGFWQAMALSWLVAAFFGFLIGAPTLRLRGDYLAIVTLGFGEIVPDFFVNTPSITGGPGGIGQIARPPAIPLPGGNEISFLTTDQRNWYWLILIVGIFSVFVINRLHRSRLGRSWAAIREDELAASSMGINLVRTKLWAFALGASFSGFAGAIYAGYITIVYPDQFQFSISVILLCMVILGGLGSMAGVIVGGLLIQSFDRILAEELNAPIHWVGDKLGLTWLEEHNLQSDRFLIFGLALVLMMLLRPGGLIPSNQRKRELTPEDQGVLRQEQEQLYDIRQENEPAAGERA